MRTRILAIAGAATLLLAGCAASEDEPGHNGDMVTTLPESPATVTTEHPVTVLDDGDGAELCLGPVAESYPPQCGGPTLIGWNWDDHEDTYEQAGDTRWGQYIVTGEYDLEGQTFTPSEITPGADYVWPERQAPDFSTPCP